MISFIKTNKKTEIVSNKELDIGSLAEEIRLSLGAKKWQDDPNHQGFSGITIVSDGQTPPNNKIIVHWTNDGINGFDIEFSPEDKSKIDNVIKLHKKR